MPDLREKAGTDLDKNQHERLNKSQIADRKAA